MKNCVIYFFIIVILLNFILTLDTVLTLNNFSKDNIVSVEVTFDRYEYHGSKYRRKNVFHFWDYKYLNINFFYLIGDVTEFQKTFFNTDPGLKLYVSYFDKTYDIVELRTDDTTYISLESTKSGIQEQIRMNLYSLILYIPLFLIGLGMIVIKIANNRSYKRCVEVK